VLYLSGAIKAHLPAMVTPDMGQSPPPGQPWAADNGCFSQPGKYTDERYLAFLAKLLPYVDRCLFATAPDVMGDAVATLDRSRPMLSRIRDVGYPVALVAQDGLTPDMVPWADIDALFIGGTTTWKLSEASHDLCVEAKRRGKWLHMGRVNSRRRYELARSFGCDSVDGTSLRFDPHTPVVQWMSDASERPHLWRAA
jgi:hypothetical protein